MIHIYYHKKLIFHTILFSIIFCLLSIILKIKKMPPLYFNLEPLTVPTPRAPQKRKREYQPLLTLEQMRRSGILCRSMIKDSAIGKCEDEGIVFANEEEKDDELNTTFIAGQDVDICITNPGAIGANVVANYHFFDPELLESFMACAGPEALHCSNCTCILCVRD